MTATFVALFCFLASWVGVATQSVAMFLVLAWLILGLRSVDSKKLVHSYRSSIFSQMALIFGLVWVGLALMSSALNPWTSGALPAFLGGYLWWALGPFTFAALAGSLEDLDNFAAVDFARKFRRIAWILLIGASLIAASQYIYGWKLHGIQVIPSEHRARILFSHPLSLAYILLLYVPLSVALLLQHPRSRLILAVAGALLFLLFVSSSRSVQAVLALLGGVFVLFGLRGRLRLIAMGVFFSLGVLVATTDNPIRGRFISTLEQKEDRQQTRYADDRIAFWAVHWDMFMEKPLVGHGLSYRQDYLDRYYNAHGLMELEKKYPAHNLFLQILVNTGVFGLLLWLARIGVDIAACVYLIRGSDGVRGIFKSVGKHTRRSPVKWIGWVGLASIAGMLLAGLTQNAFQDSAVRFHWTILECLLLWFSGRQAGANEHIQVAKLM